MMRLYIYAGGKRDFCLGFLWSEKRSDQIKEMLKFRGDSLEWVWYGWMDVIRKGGRENLVVGACSRLMLKLFFCFIVFSTVTDAKITTRDTKK